MEMNRVLLKLSGEALAGEKKHGFDEKTVYDVAGQVKKILDKGIQLCVVIGGGNFWRGRTSENMDRVKADSIGMLATVMNCIYTADAFRVFGIKSHIMTPFACGTMTELFNRDKAVEYMEQGEVVFFAGGIGHPYFSTDMATVLMAVEVKADVVLSAKAIDGVYDSDPAKNPNAKMFEELDYIEVIQRKLSVMDSTAISLCMDNKIPIVVFNIDKPGNILKAALGQKIGTLVGGN